MRNEPAARAPRLRTAFRRSWLEGLRVRHGPELEAETARTSCVETACLSICGRICVSGEAQEAGGCALATHNRFPKHPRAEGRRTLLGVCTQPGAVGARVPTSRAGRRT